MMPFDSTILYHRYIFCLFVDMCFIIILLSLFIYTIDYYIASHSAFLSYSGFQMTVEKPKPKQLLRRTTIGADSAMNQSQFLAITCNSLEAREKSRVHGAIGFGFDSHWLKNWRESF